MKNYLKIILATITALILIIFIFYTFNASNHRKLGHRLTDETDYKVSNTLQSNNNNMICFIEEFSIEAYIMKYQLILYDSTGIIRTENCGRDLQFRLNKDVSEYIKKLLLELYTTHNTILTEDAPRFKYRNFSAMPYWTIHMVLDNRIIHETIPYDEYMLIQWSTDNNAIPFKEPFYRYRDLIDAITLKIDIDVYNDKFHITPQPKKWVTEMFHDEYYEPYNEIISNKYIVPVTIVMEAI